MTQCAHMRVGVKAPHGHLALQFRLISKLEAQRTVSYRRELCGVSCVVDRFEGARGRDF